MGWQDFETKIREIASFRWNCTAVAEDYAGVKCDCILKLSPEEWIVIEITENNTLQKVREDIAKLQVVRCACKQDDIFCRAYIVVNGNPTGSMRESGQANKIRVLSETEFQNEFFDYSSYVFNRRKKQFGSLISVDGRPEENKYVSVSYNDIKTGDAYTIDSIINALKKGKRIVLKGDFGLGKSRCIKELFEKLTKESSANPYTIAINLREHWGAIRAQEILSRHFQDLGLQEDNYIKIFDQLDSIYLLDGFDEIVTQSWTSDTNRMRLIREKSVCAVKDLIQKAKGGVLIAGREYFFNSDEELLRCLGLSKKDVIILECPPGFSDSELQQFIDDNISKDLVGNTKVPEWFPRRPLVIQ